LRYPARVAFYEQFRLLVDLALRAGTEDNETALLAQYEIPREKATTWAGY
jgi:hypothetical protein